MSDGIILICPSCGGRAIQKEYDLLKIKLKHPKQEKEWYNSFLPIYTCEICEKQWVIERVVK